MIKCEYCDSILDSNLTQCPNCGAIIPVTVTQPEPEPDYTTEQKQPELESQNTQADASRAAATLAGVAGAAAGVFSLFSKNSRKTHTLPPHSGIGGMHGGMHHGGLTGRRGGPDRNFRGGPGGHRGGKH